MIFFRVHKHNFKIRNKNCKHKQFHRSKADNVFGFVGMLYTRKKQLSENKKTEREMQNPNTYWEKEAWWQRQEKTQTSDVQIQKACRTNMATRRTTYFWSLFDNALNCMHDAAA